MPYIEKRIYSGAMLEIERYAVTARGNRLPRRARESVSSEAQQKLNDRNAVKKLCRLINCNFHRGDFFMSMSYTEKTNLADAKKELQKFLRKLRDTRKKNGLSPLKYIAITETAHGKPHHHIIINSEGQTMDEVESMWEHGRVNMSRIQPDAFGMEGLARYLIKNQHSGKRWSGSQNLKKPKIVKKEIKRINIYKVPRPLKGYTLVDYEAGDNSYTGPWQRLILTNFEFKKKAKEKDR